MSRLTDAGKVSGDALLFLVGTAIGAIFTLLQQQLSKDRRVVVVHGDD